MELDEFDFELPKELISQERRIGKSKLLIVKNELEIVSFENIIDLFNKGDCLILNNTKVLPSKLIGKKITGGKIEVLIIKKIENVYESFVMGKHLKIGDKIIFDFATATIVDKKDHFYLEFDCSYEEILKHAKMPLPPYIKKEITNNDEYQNVFAKEFGSIAAPTAGFHFSEELLEKTIKKGVDIAYVTLHVGLGTFLPVKTNNVLEHKMHSEFFTIDKENADKINNAKRRIVVGTTSLRALESANENGKIIPCSKNTSIFIYPGYNFKTDIYALITNFHLPKSTLLMLVYAFGGTEKLKEAYKYAVENKLLFFSFGDAMIIFRK